MARSLLQSFVNGTRQMLSAQLFISILAVALAGWTLAITNQVIRERDALRDRVVQLEQTMAARGEIPPEPNVVVRQSGAPGPYPGTIREARLMTAPESADAAPAEARGITDVIGSFFAPAPPIGIIVLHVRNEADRSAAEAIARQLQDGLTLRTAVRVMGQGDASQPGYSYFDGRQNRAAAALMDRFHNLSRDSQLAAWAAQLQGVALPARGEYTPDRLDIVLPPLPEPAAPPLVVSAPAATAPR